MNTKHKLLDAAKSIYARSGYDGLSMRTLAKESGVNLSGIYHHFSDKDVLLDELFEQVRRELGVKRASLPKRKSAVTALRDRIAFQFDNIEDVVFILKYYLHFRPKFLHTDSGYVPTKAYLHIQEVIEQGVLSGEFILPPYAAGKEAKVITHAINGFLLEYYPETPKKGERKEVIDSIHEFIIRGITRKEVPMV